MLQLYSAAVCPFAQRTRAFLATLGLDYQLHEIDLSERDPAFLRRCPTGRVPLLVDGKFELFESAVINDYLAETRGYDAAYDDDPETRATERLAMAVWDGYVVPTQMRALRDPDTFDSKQFVALMQQLLQTVHRTDRRVGNLLSFHVAPFWARFDWMRDHSPVAGVVDEFIDLKKWLDQCVAQPGVQETLPDREATVARYVEQFVGS